MIALSVHVVAPTGHPCFAQGECWTARWQWMSCIACMRVSAAAAVANGLLEPKWLRCNCDNRKRMKHRLSNSLGIVHGQRLFFRRDTYALKFNGNKATPADVKFSKGHPIARIDESK
eukprot:2915725-Amphidinium_carterae.1